MNDRNPTGPIGYRSPGRRRLADELAGHHPSEPTDPEYRRLLGIYVRAASRVRALPPQAHSLRQAAEIKQRIAFRSLKFRFEALQKAARLAP